MAKNLTYLNTSGVTIDFRILWHKEPRLSLSAIGVYVKIIALSSIPDWEFSLKGLASVCKEEIDAVRSAVKELEAVGLLKRGRRRVEGRLGPAEWVVLDAGSIKAEIEPADPTEVDSPASDPPTLDFPTLAEPTLVPPTLAFPTLAAPTLENPTQIRDILKEEQLKEEKPPIPPAQPPAAIREHASGPYANADENTLRVKIIPEELQPLRNEILTFWDEHKGGKKSQRAWDNQMSNLKKILSEGGMAEVKSQLEKAEHAAIHKGRPWLSIAYSNWRVYGISKVTESKNNNGKGSPSSYSRSDRPGPPIERMTVEELRRIQGIQNV